MIYDRDPTLRPSSSVPPYAPGDPGVELAGTVGDPVVSPEFKFESASDSNVVVEVTRQTGTPRITVGVYYV